MFWLLASSCSDRRGSRVQHIGSHPHSPGRCGRRPFIFTVLRTCQMSTLAPSRAVLMVQFWTYFWRFRQCQLNFMPFASTLHAAVAFSRATLSALDIFAASAGLGTNAMPPTSTVAIVPANEAERWSHFLRQPAKVDSTMQRTIHHEDAETVFGGV